MPFGYNGKILHIDLTLKEISIEEPSPAWYRAYLGGSAMALYYLLKNLDPNVNPLSEKNVLIFASSVVTGAPISGFSRYTVSAKSPLTGGFGEAEAGGYWGPELKFAGFEAIVIKGKAESPVYIWIHNGKAEIRDAEELWGLDNGEVKERITRELGDERIRVASIGPAGERLVRFANVINELRHSNGRTGMGAVMGSKNLKAIAVRGDNRLEYAKPDLVKEIARWHNERIKTHGPNIQFRDLGTPGLVAGLNALGILPTRNFREGVFEGAEKINGQTLKETILKEAETCYACAVRCKRVVSSDKPYPIDPKFGGPEYETVASLGSFCGIDNLPAIAKGHEMCNRFGIDTISTGAVISFAMECFEAGILTEADTGGREIRFGNEEAMLRLIEDITYRRGLGDILAEGVRVASERIGKGAERFAFHSKGQEAPMHDPRGKTSVALSYALSPTGADHLEAQHETAFQIRSPLLDQLAPLGILEPIDPFSLGPEKVRAFTIMQRVWYLYNSLGICNFTAAPLFALTFPKLVEAVSAITGWDTSLWELLRIGEKANVMARIFNIREGIDKKADLLPRRFFEPMPSGPLVGKGIDEGEFHRALELYYEILGWDENGVPRAGRLIDLELEWLTKEPR
ncbi:MAG: aldehyde ferredoxin oxidoreductase family protein [Syntrophorhabdaceae bacterium]|nr:aldehyde ferredoxin oxidoreductase family protein [Syntrophorhabdaceae bacterium]